MLCPPRLGESAAGFPATPPPAPCPPQHRAAPGHPRKWQLSPTKPPNKAWARRSKPNCREGDTTGIVRGGSVVLSVRGATWANTSTKGSPDWRLETIATGSPPRGPHHPRAQLLTLCLSVLQPSPASSRTGSGPAERRRPLVCFQAPPEDDTGVREEGKIPGGGNRSYSPACWTENAPSLLSPSSRLAAKFPNSWKKLEPVPNPSAHQPGGSLPSPHHNRMNVCAGECEWEDECA